MATELDLTAVVPEPEPLQQQLRRMGEPQFRGMLRDRRLNRDGTLSARDEVLRARRWLPLPGPISAELAWKGPTR